LFQYFNRSSRKISILKFERLRIQRFLEQNKYFLNSETFFLLKIDFISKKNRQYFLYLSIFKEL
jgi:hypothetical protein